MFRNLLSLDEAKKRINRMISTKPLGIESVPILKALGRVLAEDIVSSIDVPPFHRSTVDGYAVRAEDTFDADENSPVELKLVGRVEVGEISNLVVKKVETVEIVTGAPVPRGADAIVMVENTAEQNGKILIYKPVTKNENIMKMGSDIYKNEIVLKRGVTLHSRELGVMAALGFADVKVFAAPKVAIISTGAEIVELGKPLPLGRIYDINTYTLTAAVLENGGEPIGFGIVQDDDAKLLKATLRKAIAAADIVLTSGGVSVGPKDVVPKIINELGKPGVIIHGVAVKPGKPVAVALINNKPVFSLPGHPTSSLLIFDLLARPVIFKMAGKVEKPLATVKASVTQKLFSARGRHTFITVTLACDDKGRWLASPVPTGQSGAITTLAKADGYVELTETQQFIEAGREVTVSLFKTLESHLP